MAYDSDIKLATRLGEIVGIDRGAIAITSGNTAGTATITAVDETGRSVLYKLGEFNAADDVRGTAGLLLTNSTTITATRSTDTSATTQVYYQLVEYAA